MIHCDLDANVFPDGMVMMALDQTQKVLSTRQSQSVKVLGTPEGAVNDLRPQGTIVIVKNVIRPQQHLGLFPHGQTVGAASREQAQFGLCLLYTSPSPRD